MPKCNKGMGCLVCSNMIQDYCGDCGITADKMGHTEFIEHTMSFCDATSKPTMRVSD